MVQSASILVDQNTRFRNYIILFREKLISIESRILPTLSEFLKRKGQLAEKTLEGVLYEALKGTMSEIVEILPGAASDSPPLFKATYDRIYDEVKEITDATEFTNPTEHAIYSVEYGKITHRQIIDKCKRVFHGSPDRIGNSKTLLFDKATEIIEVNERVYNSASYNVYVL